MNISMSGDKEKIKKFKEYKDMKKRLERFKEYEDMIKMIKEFNEMMEKFGEESFKKSKSNIFIARNPRDRRGRRKY